MRMATMFSGPESSSMTLRFCEPQTDADHREDDAGLDRPEDPADGRADRAGSGVEQHRRRLEKALPRRRLNVSRAGPRST